MTQKRRKTDLTPSEKLLIAQFLIPNSTNGVVHAGKLDEAAASYGVCRRTIGNVWAAAKKSMKDSVPMIFKSNKLGVQKTGKLVLNQEQMKAIPFAKRSTIRRLAKELNVSKSRVGRWVKVGAIKPHTNAINPELTAANKVLRIKYCLNQLQVTTANTIKFGSMHNVIHIDEKWFYMTRGSERYYMVPGEQEPHRSCKSKRYIPKVMFMCAVGRPLYASDGTLIWDGKIGMFPFTTTEPARRNNRNRARGTMVTAPIDSITKEVTRECLVHKIIPAIKANWPAHANKNIFIQQDNAKPHINNNDPEFRAAATSDGFNIQLICQPANSPDTNINDLGWFRALQSLQVETASYTIDELVKNVLLSYQNLSHTTLNNVFLSLQACLIEIMKVRGSNNYQVPHMKKGVLIKEGRLPLTLDVDEQLVRACIQELIEAGEIEGGAYNLNHLLSSLGY